MSLKYSIAVVAALGLLPAGAARAEEADCKPADLASLSGWDGIWQAEGMKSGLNGRVAPGQDDMRKYSWFQGFTAPYNEKGQRLFDAILAGNNGSVQGGWGFPVMMSAPTPFEITIGLSKTTFTGEYRDIRVIYTDGRGHDPDGWPTLFGDSIGCWEGDTLVVETTMVHYMPDFNWLAAPLSDNAVFQERYRLAAPDRLELDAVVTDPETLSKPWVVHVNYIRNEFLNRVVIEGSLRQNDRVVTVDGKFAIAGAKGGLAEDEAPGDGGN